MQYQMVEWPYPIKCREREEVTTDVLVLGGEIAGCWAALAACRMVVNVVIVEKAHVSSSGPAGCDHWVYATTNLFSKVSPEELLGAEEYNWNGYLNGITFYITAKDSWDILLEYEKYGAKIRDTDNEFEGAAFRDPESKFLYDYDNKHMLRVWGQTFKPALYKALLAAGVKVFNRISATSLLTSKKDGVVSVTGSTGVNTRTGKFYVFKAKAVVLATNASSGRLWFYTGHKIGLTKNMPRLGLEL
jgi:succinate dehydrogenase/fumarate reductase flavoprotein subunit